MIFPLNRAARLAVFASGTGSNLDALLQYFNAGQDLAHVHMVMSDRAESLALTKARAKQISSYTFPFPARKNDPLGEVRKAFEAEASKRLLEHKIDLICLAGFMKIFSSEFNTLWQGRLLNIHPSLLPDFKGLHPQEQALKAGVSEAGCSVHFVDAGIDTGQVILQKRVPVHELDSVETLSKRILALEHVAYPEAIEQVLKGQVYYASQKVAL